MNKRPNTRDSFYNILNRKLNRKLNRFFCSNFFPDSGSITINVEVLNHGSKHLRVNRGLSATSHIKQKIISVLLTTL